MASYFGVFASPVDVDVTLEGEDERKQVELKQEKEKTIKCPVYYDGESLVGQVSRPMMLKLSVYPDRRRRQQSGCGTGRSSRTTE